MFASLPPLAWLGLAGFLVLVVAGGAWWARRQARAAAPEPLPEAWPLQSRPVFDAEERRVYRLLVETFPHHAVLVKLPLVRFCQPEEGQDDVHRWYRLLGAQSVTFALCSASARVVACIDLEGRRAPSERSLRIKQDALAACRVRYLRCRADNLPSPAELQLLVPQGSAGLRGPQPAPSGRGAVAEGPAEGLRRGRRPLWRDPGFLQEGHHGRQAASATAPISILPVIAEQTSHQRGREADVDLSQDLAEALGDAATAPPPMSARH